MHLYRLAASNTVLRRLWVVVSVAALSIGLTLAFAVCRSYAAVIDADAPLWVTTSSGASSSVVRRLRQRGHGVRGPIELMCRPQGADQLAPGVDSLNIGVATDPPAWVCRQ